MFSFSVFIKFLVKGVIAYGVIAKIWTQTNSSMYLSILLYVIDYPRNKKRVMNWFKNLMR